ncbi:OmpA family protein [Herbaspirillum rubrisubalbicans]|uniref:OmpA family protein n=1 Tax=Herbaspirillum rubrisubalbicans TaxID=80842 RepID=UPI0002D301DD|nr:OmpA family protein [Herbaspirillum rubrisubalbicans]
MSKEESQQEGKNLTSTEIKDLAQAEEARAKTFSTRVELIRRTIPAVLVGYGVVLSYLYFVLGLRFFPSGLNVGDTLFLIFVTFGYTLLFWIIAGCGMLLMVPPWVFAGRIESHTKKNPQSAPLFEMACYAGAGLIVPLLFSSFFFNEVETVTALVVRLVIAALVMAAVVASARLRGDQVGRKMGSDLQPKVSEGAVNASDLLNAGGSESNISKEPGEKSNTGNEPVVDTKAETKLAIFGDVLVNSLLFSIGLILTVIAIHFDKDFGTVLVVTAAAAGTFLALALMCLDKKHESRSKKLFKFSLGLPLFLAALASLMPLYLDGFQGGHRITKGIFGMLGVNGVDATVILKGDSLRKVEAYKDEPGITVDICENGPGSAIVSGVDILWHGIGTRSLLRLGAKGMPELELSASEVSMVRGDSRRCHELKTAIYFKTGSVVPIAGEYFNDIKDEFRFLLADKAAKWDLAQVSIIGFADPQRMERGNEALSFQRAMAVKEELMNESAMDLSSERLFKLIPKGARSTDFSKCNEVSDPALLKECYEADRRVTVKMYFVRTPKVTVELSE